MIHINLKGSPYEIGYEHGKQLKLLVDAITKNLSRDYTFNKNIYENQTKSTLSVLEKMAPEIIEELQGIADGAEVEFMRLLYVNIKYLHYCTVIAFEDSEDGPVLGKNMDYPGYAFQTLFTITPEKGNTFIQLGCAGTISSYGGINSKGLAMGHSVVFLDNNTVSNDKGIPIAFLRRLALQYCSNTAETIEYIATVPSISVGDNIIFLDKHGTANAIEKSPMSYQIRYPNHSCIYSTNTFIHEKNSILINYKEEPINRYAHIEKLLKLNNSQLNTKVMESILSNNEGKYPICRETTQLSYIIHPEKLTMKVTDGYPTINSYNDFNLRL